MTEVARKAMDAGIPVVNLDRVFARTARVPHLIGGDNYGMGVSAGTYIGDTAEGARRHQPGDRRDPGHRSACRSPRTQPKGFADALADVRLQGHQPGRRAVHRRVRQAGDGEPAAGGAEDRRHLEPRRRPGRRRARRDRERQPQRVLHGRRRRLGNVMRDIKADNTVLKATVIYPSDAVGLGGAAGPAARAGQGHELTSRSPRCPAHHAVLRGGDQGQRRPLPAAGLRVLIGLRQPSEPTGGKGVGDMGDRPGSASAWSATPSWARPTRRPGARRPRFFDLPLEPRMAVLVGRNGTPRARPRPKLGWDEVARRTGGR